MFQIGKVFKRRNISILKKLNSTAKFDGAVSDLYAQLFIQNKPVWDHITALVEDVATSKKEKVLKLIDVATGPGEPSLTVAKAVKGLDILCTDAEKDMIDKANVRIANAQGLLSPVTTAIVNADSMPDYPDNSFDIMTVSYGHMFVKDLQGTLAEARRVLKPGGVLISSCWVNLEMYDFCMKMNSVLLGAPEGSELALNPTKLKSPNYYESQIQKAGFRKVESHYGSYNFSFEGLESAGKAFIIILLNDILARENSDEIFAKAKEEVHKYCVARNALKNNIYSVGPNQYKICVATA